MNHIKKIKFFTIVTACCLNMGFLYSQDPFRALSWKTPTAFHSFLMRDVHQQFKNRRQELMQAQTSLEAMIKYCKEVRDRYLNILGDFPEKTSLNATITGILYADGFRMEKLVFQSIPGRYVTANLYLPEKGEKFPVTVSLCGHGLYGKKPGATPALLARNGIATLVVDPIGQGERWQFMNDKGEYLTRGATTEHTLLNASCNVVGTSLAALQCWDNHRAIDYLVSRKDIDSDRIGVWGSSGGGTETAYLIGLDSRVKVAAICSYFSERERTLELQGPSDGCQHVPHEGLARIELADFPLMIAPAPILILSGRYDFVDLWGAMQGVEQLKESYKILGVPERVKQLVVETGHGLGKEKRNELVTWFKHWLAQDDSPLIDKEENPFTLEQSYCTLTGQVITSYKDAVSIPEENLHRAQQLSSERGKFMAQKYEKIREGISSLLKLPDVGRNRLTANLTHTYIQRGYTQYHYELIREGLIPIPCILIVPDKMTVDSQVDIVLDDMGKDHFLRSQDNIQEYINNGRILAAVDLRGFGETEDPEQYNDAKYWNREYRTAMTSLHIGKPLIGQRVADLLTLLDFVSTNEHTREHVISLRAAGLYGPVAMHAAVLDDRISQVIIRRSIKSYQEFMTSPLQKDMFPNMIYGVLRYYDLPDLVAFGKGRIRYDD